MSELMVYPLTSQLIQRPVVDPTMRITEPTRQLISTGVAIAPFIVDGESDEDNWFSSHYSVPHFVWIPTTEHIVSKYSQPQDVSHLNLRRVIHTTGETMQSITLNNHYQYFTIDDRFLLINVDEINKWGLAGKSFIGSINTLGLLYDALENTRESEKIVLEVQANATFSDVQILG